MSFSSKVQSFLKSLSDREPPEEPKKDGDPDPTAEAGSGSEPAKEGGSPGNEDDVKKGDLVDATTVLNGLVFELGEINKSLKTLIESQSDVGESIVGVAEMVNRIANTPLPPKSAAAVIAKGGAGSAPGAFPGAAQPESAPTQDEFERAQAVLIKSYKDGEITLNKSEQISSDLQKSMRLPGFKMKPEDYNFLVSKMRTA